MHRVLDVATSFCSLISRLGAGVRATRPVARPAQPLRLDEFEAGPFCRKVRETLCGLELPYLLHNVGKYGAGRPAFVARSGR